MAVTIGSTGNSSQLTIAGTGNDLNMSVGGASILKLTPYTGFDRTTGGSYTIASITGGPTSFFQIDGTNQSTGTIATYTVGGMPTGTGPVTFDVSDFVGLLDGDSFRLNYDSSTNLVSINFAPVPEPAAVVLIAVAALGLGQLVRRRKVVAATKADTATTSV